MVDLSPSSTELATVRIPKDENFINFIKEKDKGNDDGDKIYVNNFTLEKKIFWRFQLTRLLNRKVDPNTRLHFDDTFSLLTMACLLGLHDVVRRLLAHEDIDANAEDQWGYTAAFHAVRANEIQCVQELANSEKVDWNFIVKGLDTKITLEEYRYSIVTWAAKTLKFEILQVLTEVKNINWNLQDVYGKNVVHHAVSTLKEEGDKILKLLMEKVPGIDWNARDMGEILR